MRLLFLLMGICICWGCTKPPNNDRSIAAPISQEDSLPSAKITALEKKVYSFNNRFFYDSSQQYIQHFLEQPNISNSERFYAFLIRSYTYKRLFDYPSTFYNLDSALFYGKQTPFSKFFETNIQAQRALALFDTHNYQAADSLMQLLKAQKYAHLDTEYTAKIIMQEAYILYLNKEYAAAKQKYLLAGKLIQKSSPCDMPMIYGKMIQLYGAIADSTEIKKILFKGLACADSCGIEKYTLYLYETAIGAYLSSKNYTEMSLYHKKFNILNDKYRSSEYLNKIHSIENKYKLSQKEKLLLIKTSQIKEQKAWIVFLILSLWIIGSIIVIYGFWQRQKLMQKEQKQHDSFTQRLFEDIEAERERIAHDLHDGINHELLSLKRGLNEPMSRNNIDKIIGDIREICRNLHPVMLKNIGLRLSVETLCEQFSDSNTLFISYEIEDTKHLLSPNEELQIFRIIQEALVNTAKYAEASVAKVSILKEKEHIMIEIRDNGKGFNVEESLNSATAFGLPSILQRAKNIKAKANIESSSKGTIIQIFIPYSDKHSKT